MDSTLHALSALAAAADAREARIAWREASRTLGPELEEYRPLLELLCSRAAELSRLRRLAGTDELTGLPNRRAFRESLDREVARLARGGHPFAVVMLDLDGLKQLNDEHGHAAGDRALQLAADALSRALRASDLPSRLGGDEMAVLLPETGREGARIVAERMRHAIEGCTVEGRALRVSLGIAVAERMGTGADELVALADMRLYRDKRSRKSKAPRAA
ncbi:MAG: GGDEF domain-containing protein [Sandaracinaceae bacterium]